MKDDEIKFAQLPGREWEWFCVMPADDGMIIGKIEFDYKISEWEFKNDPIQIAEFNSCILLQLGDFMKTLTPLSSGTKTED